MTMPPVAGQNSHVVMRKHSHVVIQCQSMFSLTIRFGTNDDLERIAPLARVTKAPAQETRSIARMEHVAGITAIDCVLGNGVTAVTLTANVVLVKLFVA